MSNHTTGAQRYNARMDKIFVRSEELGHHTLHGSTEGKKDSVAKKMKAYKPSKQKKGESDHQHYGRLAKEFYSHGKDLPKGKPAAFYQ